MPQQRSSFLRHVSLLPLDRAGCMHTSTDVVKSVRELGSYNAAYVWMISSVAALGGCLFGYDWVVIGGAKPFYERNFRLVSEESIGWANSSALLGCLLGSVLCGFLGDRFGRKRPLTTSAFLFAVSSLYTGLAQSFSVFVAWRIIGGVAIGIASNVSPIYIAEVSSAALRGRFVTLNQLAIVVGILAAQIVNWLIAERVPDDLPNELIRQSWNGQLGWRWMFIAVAVPSVLFFICSFLIPESPRWLAKEGRGTQARRTLERIGGEHYATNVLRDIEAALEVESRTGASWQELVRTKLLAVVFLGVGLAVFQQWSGINVIFNYAGEIYRSAGYGVSGVFFNIALTGTLNLVFTLVALSCVDRFGRRALMLFGYAGITVSHLMLALAYAFGLQGLPFLILTLCTIACYALSLAPVTWVLISELCPNRGRGAGVSIAVSALWIACFVLTFTFLILNRRLGPSGAFCTYGAICLAGFLFVLMRVPETKGKTLEEIEREVSVGLQDRVG